MKAMTWATPKGFPRVSSPPRSLYWIVVLVGVLAAFLIFASWILVSYPIGATVHGYFYGVDSSEKFDLSVSPINKTSTDVHLDKNLDLVDNSASPDLQSSTISTGLSSDSKIEHIDAKTNSQVPFSESASPIFPITKELNGLETSDAAASSSQEPMTTFGSSTDVINSILSAHSNSQIDLTSTAPLQVAGTNSTNMTGNIRIEEPTSAALINKSSTVITMSNETSVSPSDPISTAVPASSDKPNNESYAGSVNSGCICYRLTQTCYQFILSFAALFYIIIIKLKLFLFFTSFSFGNTTKP